MSRSTLNLLDQLATSAHERWMIFEQAAQGTFERNLARPDALQPSAAQELKRELRELGQIVIDREYQVLTDDLDRLSEIARTDAFESLGIPVTDELEERFYDASQLDRDAILDHAGSELAAQCERDIAQIIYRYQELMIRTHARASAENLPVSVVVPMVLIERRQGKIQTWFVDRASRRISSLKFIRRMWRDKTGLGFRSFYISALVAAGETTARVWHPDSSHRAYGLELVLTAEDAGLPDYEDIFHPSTNALPMASRAFEEIAG